MCMCVEMSCVRAIVCVGDPERKIRVGSRVWYFEMHRILGPAPINKRTGTGLDGTRAFWNAVTLWAQQGERIGDDGFCVYECPPRVPVYRLSRGNYTTDAKLAARFGVTEPASFVDAVDPHDGGSNG